MYFKYVFYRPPACIPRRRGMIRVAEYLVNEAGANVNAVNHRGDTALILAAFWGRVRLVDRAMIPPSVLSQSSRIGFLFDSWRERHGRHIISCSRLFTVRFSSPVQFHRSGSFLVEPSARLEMFSCFGGYQCVVSEPLRSPCQDILYETFNT